jgi:hypothetical protein
MNVHNPYAPPTAPVADLSDEQWRKNNPPPFFAVSVMKLLVMSICTAGFYQLYWFYKNWDRIKADERLDIMPLMRAIFSVFFCYQLFARMKNFEHPGVQPGKLLAGPLATIWIVTNIMWRLPDPYWLPSLFSFIALLPAQRRANKINAAVDPGHLPNNRFTALNWVAIVIFASIFMLAIIGIFLPEPVE